MYHKIVIYSTKYSKKINILVKTNQCIAYDYHKYYSNKNIFFYNPVLIKPCSQQNRYIFF